MSEIDLAAIKSALADVPGIETLTVSMEGGRAIYRFSGGTAAISPFSSEDQIVVAIRNAAALGVPALAHTSQAAPKATTMSAPAPGSFAASLKAMMDEARAGVVQARVQGLAKVQEAVGKLHDARAATTHVTAAMAKAIEDEANSVLAELGQISNDLTGESNG